MAKINNGSHNHRGPRRGIRSALLALSLMTFLPAAEAQSPGPAGFIGVWYDDTGKGAVEISSCGSSLCGRIVWLREPNDANGRPLTDGYNPEAGKRKRPICGLPVLGGLKRQSNGTWDDGWIYDPKEGKSYDVELRLRGADTLQVTGYIGTKLFSESFTWVRAPASLPRCAAASGSSTTL